MPVLGSDQQPQRTFPSRLQRYWEHPHPYGLIAMLKSTLDSIDDAVNGSIAATGVSPSTEEEAYRYNQARDRGEIGAFRAAADFSPAVPEFAGAALGRRAISGPVPQAIEGRSPHVGSPPSLSGAGPYSSARPETIARGWRPPVPGVSVPSVPPPAVGATPPGGLLARLRELDALERPQHGTDVGPVSPGEDPNFRELRRVLIRPQEAGTFVPHSDGALGSLDSEVPISGLQTSSQPNDLPEWRADGSNFPGSGRRGGGPGKGGGGGRNGGNGGDDFDDFDDAHPCTRRWAHEMFGWCPQFWTAGARYVAACEARATGRSRLCWRNKGYPVPDEPARYSWNDIPRTKVKKHNLRPRK